MRLYTRDECAAWCNVLGIALDDRREPTRDLGLPYHLRAAFPSSFTQLLWFSRTIEAALQPRTSCLVWMSGYGIFPSNENHHLYYRLRQSYGDFRLLHEAPGHVCLDYEVPEVVTLIELALLFGWDAHLIPTAGYARAFVSHDEWMEIGFTTEQQKKDFQAALERAKVPMLAEEA